MLNKLKATQSGNAAIAALVVLVIAAVIALAYLSGNLLPSKNGAGEAVTAEAAPAAPTDTAAAAPADAPPAAAASAGEKPKLELVPGNPVVAKVAGQEILRQDVFGFMQTLPPQTRQMPLEQLYPLALEQVINAKLVQEKSKGVNVENDPEFKKQMELAKQQIEQTVYLQNLVNEKVTDSKLQEMYDKLVASTPKETEVKAAHILVPDEATAKEVVKKLIETGDFAALAKEYSKDATAEKGGDLGYFIKGDVVKEFGDAAFAMEPGTYTKEPIKTQFGYHVIKVDDKRERQPPTLEQAKPFLEANLRREILEGIVKDWRDSADIKRYDMNGTAEIPAPAAAPAQ